MNSIINQPHNLNPSNRETHHEGEKTPGADKNISRKYLTNKLNYINFQDLTIIINLRHKKYGNILSLPAKPFPCKGDRLDCVWVVPPNLDSVRRDYTFHNLLIPDGNKLLLATSETINLYTKGFSLLLPESCREVAARRVTRHPCTKIKAHFTQNSVLFHGKLLDFSPISFKLEIASPSHQSFKWVDIESPVNLHLFADGDILEGDILYSGECRIIRQEEGLANKAFVLEPINDRIRRRFKPKEYRSTRQKLLPLPSIVFRHPFTGRIVNLNISNLSGNGFAVEEDEGNSVLLSGMMIPEIELSFAESCKVKCRAQVIYSNKGLDNENDGIVTCGLAILDMDVNEHLKVLSVLQHATNQNSYVCTTVDMDALWHFFFDVGFIYPDKYADFQANKDKIKNTYKKLYGQNPDIARHFIFQSKGSILGHMAMMRFYDKSWLIHHHAATRTESMKAGLIVLKQISSFANDSHNISSAKMNYVFCYYRPNNSFPERVFGGLVRHLKQPKICSLDTFAYFHFQSKVLDTGKLPSSWDILWSQPEDLLELKLFYEHRSGGLMIDAFDLKSGIIADSNLSQEYCALGFKKEKYLLSLKEHGSLKAIVIINISDTGLNLSNLTNCATIVSLDDDIPSDILNTLLSIVSKKYEDHSMPVLLYPAIHADKWFISVEKIYNLWVLDLQYLDHYFKYLDKLIRFIKADA